MLLLVVAIAVFIAWSWLSYPAIGYVLYDLSVTIEARLYRLHKIVVPISEMTVSTWQGGPYEATSSVLMLHGYSADKNLWLRFARHFVGSHRVIIPDIAGHGETGFKAGGGYDIALQAKRMIQLLDVCGVEKVHVIGNSMGAMAALALLARHPGIARSHINISGAARALPFSIAIRSLQREAIPPASRLPKSVTWNGSCPRDTTRS